MRMEGTFRALIMDGFSVCGLTTSRALGNMQAVKTAARRRTPPGGTIHEFGIVKVTCKYTFIAQYSNIQCFLKIATISKLSLQSDFTVKHPERPKMLQQLTPIMSTMETTR